MRDERVRSRKSTSIGGTSGSGGPLYLYHFFLACIVFGFCTGASLARLKVQGVSLNQYVLYSIVILRGHSIDSNYYIPLPDIGAISETMKISGLLQLLFPSWPCVVCGLWSLGPSSCTCTSCSKCGASFLVCQLDGC